VRKAWEKSRRKEGNKLHPPGRMERGEGQFGSSPKDRLKDILGERGTGKKGGKGGRLFSPLGRKG